MRAMARKRLPKIGGKAEKLGLLTIMDRELAEQHGVPYVHLAAFAIDVDRIREKVEGYGDPRPFAWEVFLTEAYILANEASHASLEDTVLSIIDGEPHALGSQLAFAAWDAVVRGALPIELKPAFAAWRARPDELVEALAPLWKDDERWRRELASGCLAVELDPPIAAPTKEALARLLA
jgi:hypothetical protein